MIKTKSGDRNQVVACYVYAAYRRAYSEAVNEEGEFGDYDILYANRTYDGRGRYVIPFDDYYCPRKRQHEIIEELKKEPYVIEGYKQKHYLTKLQKESLSINFSLGCSPCDSVMSFAKRHPNIANIYEIKKEDE